MNKQAAGSIPPQEYTARRDRLVELIIKLKEQECLDEIADMLASGWEAVDLLESCILGMRGVGKRFEEGRYFIAALIMAGDIMRQTTDLLGPHLTHQQYDQPSSILLLGTIAGDIHDLGKNLFSILARFNGFEVVDLGVDVAPETFLAEAKRVNPDVIGISCVFTNAVPELKKALELLRRELPAPRPPVIIGGNCIDEQISTHVGADHWVRDAAQGLKACQELVRQRAS